MVHVTRDPYTNKVSFTPTRNCRLGKALLLACVLAVSTNAVGCRKLPAGSVEGNVVFAEEPPAVPKLPIPPSMAHQCGSEVNDPSFLIHGKALEGAVIYWVDAPPEPLRIGAIQGPTLDQKKCVYQPAILAARAGAELTVTNSDPLLHNVHVLSPTGASAFNVAMPLAGMHTNRKLPVEPGIVDVKCDVHPWMRGWIRTFNHSHFTQTDAQGHFHLDGIPAGTTTLAVWHPKLGEHRQEVSVPAGKPVWVNWVLPSP